jgi:hypothetical protein
MQRALMDPAGSMQKHIDIVSRGGNSEKEQQKHYHRNEEHP